MARGSKSGYTKKQQRMASHIEESEKKSGAKTKDAERIAWATVNKQTGGAKKKKTSKKKTAKKKSAKKKTSKKTTKKK
jgi:hypothetical protein